MVEKKESTQKLFHQNKGKSKKKTTPKKSENYWNWVAEIERNEKTTKIGSAIFAFLERMGMRERVFEQSVLEYWNDVVGEKIAKIATPRSISGGILRIAVKDSTWRLELEFREEEIRAKLNKTMGKTVVIKLIFR